MEVKRYKVKRTESLTEITGDPFLYGPQDVVSALDYASLSSRHARAIEALRGCVEAIAWCGGRYNREGDGISRLYWERMVDPAIAAARAVLEETP